MARRPKELLIYRNDLLKDRVSGDRGFNVSKFCRDRKMSREQFYNVLDRSKHVSERMVLCVAEGLGFSREDVFAEPEKNLATL